MAENKKQSNIEIADKLAKARGKENINELMAEANEMMNSDDVVTRTLGERIAQETVEGLLQLCLLQEVIDNDLPNYMGELVSRIDDGYIREGNSKEYVVDLDTGVTSYDNNAFVPDKQTLQQIEKWLIQVYTTPAGGQNVLSPQGYQFVKEQTIPKTQWLPYFKNYELDKFISMKQASLNRAYVIYMYNKLASIITDETKGKIVNGTATNLFDAILEISPLIDKMYQYNSEFNAEQSSKLMYVPKPEDLLIFTSTKVRSMIINGIKSQVFNAQFIGDSKKTFTYENLKFLGNKITQGDQDTINVDSGAEWIDDNTIIVLDISRIRNLKQVDDETSQYFAKNLTLYINKNLWGALDILPWCKKLVYKNTNLTKTDTQVAAK